MLGREIVSFVKDKLFPKQFSINPNFYGFQYISPTFNLDINLNKLLLTLDLDINSIYFALKNKIRLILTHHYFVDKEIHSFDSFLVKKLNLLSKGSIAIYSVGSAFIASEGGVSENICNKLICEKVDLFELKFNDRKIPLGRICIPKIYDSRDRKINQNSITFKKLLERAKINFRLKTIRYLGNLNTKIKKICIIGGSFSKIEYLKKAIDKNCNCFITGDFKDEEMKFAQDNKLNLLEIPHYCAEFDTLRNFKNILNLKFPHDEVFNYSSKVQSQYM